MVLDCIDKINFISVVNDYTVYNKYIRENQFIKDKSYIVLHDYDNTKNNVAIPIRYNRFLDNYDFSQESWLVFCHSDWELCEGLEEKIKKLDKNCIYGTAGAVKSQYAQKFIKSVKKFSADKGRTLDKFEPRSQLNTSFLEVDTLDCQVVFIYSTLVEKYGLRFDERFLWDLYVEDLCAFCKINYNIQSFIFDLDSCHNSDTGFILTPPKSYLEALNIINHKYKDFLFAGTVSLFGGLDDMKGNYRDYMLYHMRAKVKGNKDTFK